MSISLCMIVKNEAAWIERCINSVKGLVDQIVVVDAKEKKTVTKFKTGKIPHPGRGANWEDPELDRKSVV